MTRPDCMADAEDRRVVREALDEPLVVEAAAGTGKTTELVARMVNVVAAGRARVHELVAVTFTEKAAGELKLRFRQALGVARDSTIEAGARRALEAALAGLEDARISTIHGFCADLLREHPVEAGVDPRFEVLQDDAARRLYGSVFDAWLAGSLDAPGEGLRRALRRLGHRDERPGDGPPARRLRRAGWSLVEWRDFPSPWRRDPFDRHAALGALAQRVADVAALTAEPAFARDPLFTSTYRLRQLAHDVAVARRAASLDLDGFEARLLDLPRDLASWKGGRGRDYRAGITRDLVKAQVQDLLWGVRAFCRAADADLTACLHAELGETLRRYERAKAESGRLDFLDLLLRTRNLVRDHRDIRDALHARLTHCFVDEFQDTDPLQAEILLLLASDDPAESDWRNVTPRRGPGGSLFIVGDPKQAIYRFRRADVETYRRVCDLLVARGARRVTLRTSFRAVPTLQRLVNAAFSPEMTVAADASQPEYVPLEPARADRDDQPAAVVLPVPRPYGGHGRVSARAIEESFPSAVGAFVAWLVRESRWTVAECDASGAERRVAIEPRHVALLFRRFESWGTDVTRPYVDALEAHGIPHLLVGGRSFHAREEVATLVAALSAIEWPDDELAVYATLHGSLFAIADAALFLWKERFGRLDPFRVPEDARRSAEGGEAIAPALDLLAALHRRRNRVPVTETIEALLAATRAHAGLALRRSGEQALANVLHVVELARRYEAGGGVSFRGFVHELADGETTDVSEAPTVEEGSDGVRLMTVHKAKGLEFPVVVLADPTASLAAERVARHVDADRGLCAMRLAGWAPSELNEREDEERRRDRAEGVRVAYVAATRARDLLVVPAVGDGPLDDRRWASPLDRGIYPAPADRRAPEPASNCPAFCRDSVLERPGGDPAGPATVAPGRHRFAPSAGPSTRAPAYDVVWWDPRALGAEARAGFGLRDIALIRDVAPERVAADVEVHRAWQADRANALASGATATRVVVPATLLATADAASGVLEPDDARAVQVVSLRGATARPEGRRFGTLVHEVLAAVALDADAEAVRGTADVAGRRLGATGEEVVAASAIVVAALAHDLLARARGADANGACRREAPVTWQTPRGVVVDGQVDLAFLDGDRWVVVDFKTGRSSAHVEAYRRQLALYARAVAAATGMRAEPVLLEL